MLDGLKIVSEVQNLPDVTDPAWDQKSWPELLIKTGEEILEQFRQVLAAMPDDHPGEDSAVDEPMTLFVENIKSWLQCTQIIRLIASGEETAERIKVGEQHWPVVGHPVILAIVKRLIERGDGDGLIQKLFDAAGEPGVQPGQYL